MEMNYLLRGQYEICVWLLRADPFEEANEETELLNHFRSWDYPVELF